MVDNAATPRDPSSIRVDKSLWKMLLANDPTLFWYYAEQYLEMCSFTVQKLFVTDSSNTCLLKPVSFPTHWNRVLKEWCSHSIVPSTIPAFRAKNWTKYSNLNASSYSYISICYLVIDVTLRKSNYSIYLF